MTDAHDSNIVFFGGAPLGAPVLRAMIDAGIVPSLVVCSPDRPAGRGRVVSPPEVKEIAHEHNIPVIQPERITDDAAAPLTREPWDLFVVVAYNHILPQGLIEHPQHGTINLHPSLLPKLRGPSPIRSAILHDARDAVGNTVILLDEQMDHGPILAQAPYPIAEHAWPPYGTALDTALAEHGASLLIDTIPKVLSGDITPTPQAHEHATYTEKLTKAMGELKSDPHELPTGSEADAILRKIRAFDGFPSAYFFHNDARVKITAAHVANDTLIIERVVPEGKREMNFTDYLHSLTS